MEPGSDTTSKISTPGHIQQHLQPTCSASGVPKLNPKPLYSPGDLLLLLFFFLQPNKAGFYLGSVTLSAILGITWRPHTPQQQQQKKQLLLAFPQQKSTAESRHLSAPTFKKQENPKNVTQLRCFNNLREEFRPGASRVTQLMKFFLGNEEQLGDYIRNAPQTRCYNRKERGFT